MIKINNKKGSLRDIFFAVVIIGLVITATGVIITGWADEYGSGVGYDLNDDYSKIDEVSGTAELQKDKLSTNDPDPGSDFEANTYRGVYGIISNIYEPFRIVFGDNGMIDSVTERFGLPDYLRQVIVTLMVMGLTFALIAIIFRLPRERA